MSATRSPSRDLARLERRPVPARREPALTAAQHSSATLVADWIAAVMWRVAELMGWDDDVAEEPEPVRPSRRPAQQDVWDLSEPDDPWTISHHHDGLSGYDRRIAERRAHEIRIERHAALLAETRAVRGCCPGLSHHHC